MDLNGAELIEKCDYNSGTVFTRGIILAIIVSDVIVLLLRLLLTTKVQQRRDRVRRWAVAGVGVVVAT